MEASIECVNKDFATKSYNAYCAKRIDDPSGKGCFLIKKVPRKDGYVRWAITKGSSVAAFGKVCGERSYYIHHLAWYATDHDMPKPVEEHLSHLCHNSRCFNPDHLTVESPQLNNDRKGCLVFAKCPCPCGVVFWTCKHEPKCTPPTALETALKKSEKFSNK